MDRLLRAENGLIGCAQIERIDRMRTTGCGTCAKREPCAPGNALRLDREAIEIRIRVLLPETVSCCMFGCGSKLAIQDVLLWRKVPLYAC